MKRLVIFYCFLLAIASAEEIRVSYKHIFPGKDLKPIEIRQEENKEPIVKAFKSFSDFNKAQKEKKAEIILASFAFGKFNDDYRPVASIEIDGKDSENYLLLSFDKKWNSGNLDKAVVGVVDEVGRKNMRDFVGMLTVSKFKRMKRVNSSHELFPLLVLQSVDMILIRADHEYALREKFIVDTKQIKRTKAVLNPIFYVKKDSKLNYAEVLEKVKKGLTLPTNWKIKDISSQTEKE